MTSTPSPRPVSALRARMIEDMTVRGFTEETRSNYIRDVRAFAAFIRRPPDTATAEDLRRFQLHTRRRAACRRRASTARFRPCVSFSP
jgi:integrase/recombinase XerD